MGNEPTNKKKMQKICGLTNLPGPRKSVKPDRPYLMTIPGKFRRKQGKKAFAGPGTGGTSRAFLPETALFNS